MGPCEKQTTWQISQRRCPVYCPWRSGRRRLRTEAKLEIEGDDWVCGRKSERAGVEVPDCRWRREAWRKWSVDYVCRVQPHRLLYCTWVCAAKDTALISKMKMRADDLYDRIIWRLVDDLHERRRRTQGCNPFGDRGVTFGMTAWRSKRRGCFENCFFQRTEPEADETASNNCRTRL